MRRLTAAFLLLFVAALAGAADAPAAPARRYTLSLADAELRAVQTSDQLKAYGADAEAARAQADAQRAGVLPRLDLDASYSYVTNVPSVQLPIPNTPAIPFGTHSSSYSVGPVLTYSLWDTGAAWKSYHSLARLAEAREMDRDAQTRQLLLTVCNAYVRVQLSLEELRLVNDSLKLARGQHHDISSNFELGAASRLDLVDSQREVLSYELQFRQQQADLSSSLKDLLALVAEDAGDASHPGPPGVENVTLELGLDGLAPSVAAADRQAFSPPDDRNPQIRGQELSAQSDELSAESEKAGLYPTLIASAKAAEQYPNYILPETIQQNTFGLSLTMPLFEGGHTRRLSDQRLKEAEAARRREGQLRTDLGRDFFKAQDLLASLREQGEIAAQDVKESKESAHLYYESYRAGKINLIDVQSADLRALQAEVQAAGIDAQILQEIAQLRSLSGEETNHAP